MGNIHFKLESSNAYATADNEYPDYGKIEEEGSNCTCSPDVCDCECLCSCHREKSITGG